METQKRIAELNDRLRTQGIGGEIYLTRSIALLQDEMKQRIFKAVQEFNSFNKSNDPYLERDFGSLHVGQHHVFWKIDYYDPTKQYHSEDPSNAEITSRIMTIMMAEEY